LPDALAVFSISAGEVNMGAGVHLSAIIQKVGKRERGTFRKTQAGPKPRSHEIQNQLLRHSIADSQLRLEVLVNSASTLFGRSPLRTRFSFRECCRTAIAQAELRL
jgi:hypothetical protein